MYFLSFKRHYDWISGEVIIVTHPKLKAKEMLGDYPSDRQLQTNDTVKESSKSLLFPEDGTRNDRSINIQTTPIKK